MFDTESSIRLPTYIAGLRARLKTAAVQVQREPLVPGAPPVEKLVPASNVPGAQPAPGTPPATAAPAGQPATNAPGMLPQVTLPKVAALRKRAEVLCCYE